MDPFFQPSNPFSGQALNMTQDQVNMLSQVNNRLRQQVIEVFMNPLGLQLLDTLEDLYVRQPVCPPGCVEGYGYKREGENALILKLRNIINQAQRSA